MELVDGKIIFGMHNCIPCDGTGKRAGTKACPTCHGTGNGAKGGKDGCRKCSGMKTQPDFENRVDCFSCTGTGQVPENICDTVPGEWWKALEFKVYRSDRGQTYNEYLLGMGCVYSSTDYGDHKRLTDEELIGKVRAHTWIQATKIAKDDGSKTSAVLCDHVGIFCNAQGYSVRACYDGSGLSARAIIAMERGKAEGFRVGGILAEAGMNGTMGAIYKAEVAR